MNLLDLAVGRSTMLVVLVVIGSWLVRPAEPAPHGRVVVTDTETTILDVIEFAPGTATLRPTSKPILDAVAATLLGNPSIERVEVQSHTRDSDQILSQERADAVMKYLVDAGVDPSRLVAQGYGDTQPIDRAAPAKNERMAFLILKRSE